MVPIHQLGYFLLAQWIVLGSIGSATRELSAAVTKAAYDFTDGAPRCTTPSSSCDTGKLLHGIETNSSHTIDDCKDTSNRVYQQDENIDRIIVRSKDGGVLSKGSDAVVEAQVWTATDTSDRLMSSGVEVAHFYYSANISSPVNWTYVGTRYAFPNTGLQTLRCSYTLSGNEIQAIRVNYGYNEYIEGPCTSIGGYNDVSDVLFTVVDCSREDCGQYYDPLSMPSMDKLAPTRSLPPSISSRPSFFPSLSSAPSNSLVPSYFPTDKPRESTWWDEWWPFSPLSSSSRAPPFYGLVLIIFSFLSMFLI